MASALERSHADDPSVRYQAALELGQAPSEEAAARLVALLEDGAEVCVDEGSSVHDIDPTYRPLSAAAREALCRMGAFAWPAIAPAWSSASAEARRAMLAALAAPPLEMRARFPDEAHARIEEEARTVGVAQAISVAVWERGFAARVRSGELEAPEAFWREAHDHPSPTERDRSFIPLAAVVADPVALARELLALLARSDVWHQHIVAALVRLPPVMPPELLAEMFASGFVREHPEIWAWVARHGEPARALVPLCVAALTPRSVGGQPSWTPSLLDDRRWRLATAALRAGGPLSEDVRATLLDRLATTNESMSLEGSLRRWLLELLGDAAEVESALGPRLEEMGKSADPVAVERARQLRAWFATARPKT